MGPQSSLRQLRAYLALSLGAMTAPPPPRRSKKAATEGAAPSSATSAVPEDVRSPRPTDVHGAPPRDRGAKAGFTEVWQSPDGHLEPPPVVVSLLPPVSMRRSHHTSPPPKAAGTSTAPGLGASQWDAPLGGAAGSVPVALPRVASTPVVPRARAPQTACVSAVRAAHYTASPSPAAGDGGGNGAWKAPECIEIDPRPAAHPCARKHWQPACPVARAEQRLVRGRSRPAEQVCSPPKARPG